MVNVHTREKLSVRPSGGPAGAFVTGIDLSRALDAEEASALKKALADHLVIALPDQSISLDDLERVTDALGGRDLTPFVKPLPDRPYVIRILKEPGDKLNFANAWHSDLSYLPQPPSYTLLYCLESPPAGGDTIWANQYRAFETLPKDMQDTLLELDAVHSAGMAYGDGGYLDTVKHMLSTGIEPSKEARREQIHPAVIAHPDTAKPALYVNQVYTTRIDGWDKSQSDELLAHLAKHAVNEALTWRLQWARGTLAIWDNRTTQHFAVNDYHGHRREMVRTSVKGASPRRARA
jgi:alpha-ketoglutarate-dependent taurine dioxygenase